MHSARADHACVLLPNGGGVLVVGGQRWGLETEVFDPEKDEWTFGPPLPSEVSHPQGS